MEELLGQVDSTDSISSSSSYDSLPTCGYAFPRDQCSSCQPQTTSEPRKVKVELCRNFVENGYCIYADRCCFAHGYEELYMNSMIGNKLRTKPCRLFHKDMVCKYGMRCNFIHHSKVFCDRRVQDYQETLNLITDYPELLLVKQKQHSIIAAIIQRDY